MSSQIQYSNLSDKMWQSFFNSFFWVNLCVNYLMLSENQISFGISQLNVPLCDNNETILILFYFCTLWIVQNITIFDNCLLNVRYKKEISFIFIFKIVISGWHWNKNSHYCWFIVILNICFWFHPFQGLVHGHCQFVGLVKFGD